MDTNPPAWAIELREKLDQVLELLEGGTQAQAHGLSASLPTFGGYNCAWTVDREGHPSYILTADGEMAHRHAKQDDVWWSVKDEAAPAGYRRILGFTAAELAAGLPDAVRFRLPDEVPAQQPAPAHDDDDQPASEAALRQLHQGGRAVHGVEGWQEAGPDMILAHTDGRTRVSAEMSAGEVARLLWTLAATQEARPASYAG